MICDPDSEEDSDGCVMSRKDAKRRRAKKARLNQNVQAGGEVTNVVSAGPQRSAVSVRASGKTPPHDQARKAAKVMDSIEEEAEHLTGKAREAVEPEASSQPRKDFKASGYSVTKDGVVKITSSKPEESNDTKLQIWERSSGRDLKEGTASDSQNPRIHRYDCQCSSNELQQAGVERTVILVKGAEYPACVRCGGEDRRIGCRFAVEVDSADTPRYENWMFKYLGLSLIHI